MTRLLLWITCGLLLASPAGAAEDDQGASDQSSVLVTTASPTKGALDQVVMAYGTAQPSASGASAVAALHAAQVLGLRVVPGQSVAKGEVLLDLGAEPAATLAFQQAKSDVELAKAEFARTQRLVEQKLATKSQLDQAAKTVRDAEGTLTAREREGGGQPVEQIVAPYAGIVTTVAVSNGDHVQPGATLLDVARADREVALIGLARREADLVKPGQEVDLVDLDAPDKPIKASVTLVGRMADPKTGLVTAVVTPVTDDAGRLEPGDHVQAKIATAKVEGWIVPRDAVGTDDSGSYVFQVAGSKAIRVAVTIAGEAEDRLAVQGEVDPKRKLVTAGNYQLSEGGAVREATEQAKKTDEKAEGKEE